MTAWRVYFWINVFFFFGLKKHRRGLSVNCEGYIVWLESTRLIFFLPYILFWLGWADKLPLQWGQQDENNVFRYNTSTHTHAVEVCVCSHIEKHSLKKREGVESVSFNETTSHSHSILFVPSIYSSQCVRVLAIWPTRNQVKRVHVWTLYCIYFWFDRQREVRNSYMWDFFGHQCM